jgi:RecA/RadA recombinase
MINAQEFTLLKEGSIVEVRGNFGSGPAELATIECVEDDIKNGIPGIDYRTVGGDSHWAYIHQIHRIVTL